MENLVEVCHDDRVGTWKVDLYVPLDSGELVFERSGGGYWGKPEAVAAAEELAAAEGALLRIERADSSVQEERRP